MIRRIVHSALVMGGGGLVAFYWLLANGRTESEARNLLLVLFVLFENFQTFSSRSEHHSIFRQPLMANPLLILGVIAAQALQIGAMHAPYLADILSLQPISLQEWVVLLLAASSLLVVMEFEKWWDRRRNGPAPADTQHVPAWKAL